MTLSEIIEQAYETEVSDLFRMLVTNAAASGVHEAMPQFARSLDLLANARKAAINLVSTRVESEDPEVGVMRMFSDARRLGWDGTGGPVAWMVSEIERLRNPKSSK